MGIELGVLYGLIGMVGFGISSAIGKKISREVGSANSVFLRNLFGIPVIIIALFIFPGETYTVTQCLKIMLLGLVGYIPLVSFLKSLQYGDVGVLGPMSNASKVVTILLGILILGETITGLQTISILLVMFGSILLGLDISKAGTGISKKALLYILIAIFGWGIVFFMFKISTDATGPIITALFVEFGVRIGAIIHSFFLKKKLGFPKGAIPSRKFIGLAVLFGVFGNIGGIAINYGYTVAPVAIVTAVFACSTLVTSVYGIVVYKERLGLKEWISIIAIITGLILLSGILG